MAAAEWDALNPWGAGVRNMFSYFDAHTYFGPDASAKIDLANKITTKPFSSFDAWTRVNIPVAS